MHASEVAASFVHVAKDTQHRSRLSFPDGLLSRLSDAADLVERADVLKTFRIKRPAPRDARPKRS
jgi:hypothetical protein